MDEQIGRVLATLDRLGLRDRTLVIYTTDHGDYCGGHGQMDKHFSMYDDLLRIPFIMRWPGVIPAGSTYNQPVISLDIMPTALAAAGRPPAPESRLDGVDLRPALSGQSSVPPHETLYWRFRFPDPEPGQQRFAIRQGRWKLTRNGGPPALYDLATDPGETVDLTARESGRAAALQAEWNRWNRTLEEPRWPARLRRPKQTPAADDERGAAANPVPSAGS